MLDSEGVITDTAEEIVAAVKAVPAVVGWAGLALYVLLWDVNKRTVTLSSGFAPEGTHGRKGAVLLWLYLTLHLCRLIPKRWDPLRSFL